MMRLEPSGDRPHLAAVKQAKPRRLSLWPRVLSPLILIAFWQLVCELWQPALLPAPWAVLETFWDQCRSGELPGHLLITLQRIALSFTLAMIGGAVLGLLMGHYRLLDEWLDVPLTLLLNVPALVVIVLSLIWVGMNEAAVICAVVINKVPNMAVIFREGAKDIDLKLLQVATVFRLSLWRTVSKVYLPQLFPYFLSAARGGIALVWKIVLVVELIGCSEGMGFQIGTYFQLFDITSILAYTLAFVGVVFVFEGMIMRPLERHVQRWKTC